MHRARKIVVANLFGHLAGKGKHGRLRRGVGERGVDRLIRPICLANARHKRVAVGGLFLRVGDCDRHLVAVVPVGKGGGIGKALIGGGGVQNNGVDLVAVAVVGARKAIARVVGGAGLATDVAILAQQIVMRVHGMRMVGAVGARDFDPGILARYDLADRVVFHGLLHHQRYVVCG